MNRESTFRGRLLYLVITSLMTLAGCAELDYEGWLNKPIPIALADNIPLVQLHFADETFTSAVDTGAPVTMLDRGHAPARLQGELRLQDSSESSVTRFIFREIEVYDLELLPVGLNESLPVRGFLGASLLQNFALHLTYGPLPTLTLMDEIPDSNQFIAEDCELEQVVNPADGSTLSCVGSFNATRAGGGLVVIGSHQLDLPATRMIVPVCILPRSLNPANPGGEEITGTPANALISTGQGTPIISLSGFERLQASFPDLEQRPGATLYMPYGEEPVSTAVIDRLALVSSETIHLGPCGELARRRRQLQAMTGGMPADDLDYNGPSVTMLESPVEFAVIADQSPLFLGLRKELGPSVASVDLILGGGFLRHFEVDIDYPTNRLLLRCTEDAPDNHCRVIPFCSYYGDPPCPRPITP